MISFITATLIFTLTSCRWHDTLSNDEYETITNQITPPITIAGDDDNDPILEGNKPPIKDKQDW